MKWGAQEMKGYKVYMEIKKMQQQGFKKATVARELGINRRTATRYWGMEVTEFEKKSTHNRSSKLDKYQEIILKWLEQYPTTTASQVCDWLAERCSASFAERTVSRYVKHLREQYNLQKSPEVRSFEAVPELPMGQQMQMDFGEKWLKRADGGRIKVYGAVFSLSHSRQKYAEFLSRPYTAIDLVSACKRCFAAMGGMPRELVFDQDSVVCVSENAGDIIHTYEFEKFRQEYKITIYMCRGADPQSKGKIENVVKYLKGNFLENRIYRSDVTLNQECIAWLKRTGNAKIHGTTKRIPAEVFLAEREYLRPLLPAADPTPDATLRTVRKDNTIVYLSNRYSVPLGTFNVRKEVKVEAKNDVLIIQTADGDPICEHRISGSRGQLVQNKTHKRDRSRGVGALQLALVERLQGKGYSFLDAVQKDKPRYVRDQFQLIHTLCDRYGEEAVLEGIFYCEELRLYSANYVKDYLEHTQPKVPELVCLPIPMSDLKYHVATQKRAVSDYARAGDKL